MDADSLTIHRRKSSNKPYHIHSFQVQIFRIGAQKLFTSQNISHNLLLALKSAQFRAFYYCVVTKQKQPPKL